MPKVRTAVLDHRARWFLGEVHGKVRSDQDRSLEGLNRAGLRYGMEGLRVLGRLPPHDGELPNVDDRPGRGNLEDGDEVRLGDAEQELLKSVRACWVDGDSLSLGNLNNRILHLGESYLRYLGLIGDYTGESIFARLVPHRGTKEGSSLPYNSNMTTPTEAEKGSESESDGTIEGSINGRSGSNKAPNTVHENPSKSPEEDNEDTRETALTEAETSETEFVWDPEGDGQPSNQPMQFKGTCSGCGTEYEDGAPEAIRFPTSKRWIVLNCCGVGERFLEEHAKAGGSGNGRRRRRLPE